MTFAYYLLLVLHFIGWGIVLGGTVTNLRTPRIAPGVLHGALTALISGILMVGLAEGVLDVDVNQMKIGIKLVIALVLTGLIIWTGRRETEPTRRIIGLIAALTTINIAIAALWR